MAAVERWVEPLERERRHRVERARPSLHGIDPPAQPFDQAEGLGGAAGVLTDSHDVAEDVVDGVGVEGQHVGVTAEDVQGIFDVARRHGAHPAQVLGEDEVGLDALDQLGIEGVQRLTVLHRLPDEPVDVGRRRLLADVELRAGDDGLLGGRGRVVAPVGDRFDLVTEPEGEGDLCCRWEKADDPQSTSRSVTPTERMTSPTWIDLATSMPSMT